MLHTPTRATHNIEPRSYLGEVKAFDSLDFHIANREEDIGQLLRKIAYAKRPNIALIGAPGNAKTMTLEFILDVITGKRTIPQGHPWHEMFKTIKAKTRDFQAHDYLFLPNLQDPHHPVVLDFLRGEIDAAQKAADSFCDEMIKLTDTLGSHSKIHPYFTQGEFKEHVDRSVRLLYQKLYGNFANYTDDIHLDFDIKPSDDLQNYALNFRFLGGKERWATVRRAFMMYERKNKDDTDKKSKKKEKKQRQLIALKDVAQRLRERLRTVIRNDVAHLFSLVDKIEVPDYSQAERRKFLKETMARVDHDFDEISGLYSKGTLPYYQALRQAKVLENTPLMMSPKSLEWCVSQFQAIADAHRDKAPQSVRDWMDATVRYFRDNQGVLSDTLVEEYLEADGVSRRIQKLEKEGTPTHPYVDEFYSRDEFKIPHGRSTMPLSEILVPETCVLAGSGELSIKYPSSFSDEEMWGKVAKPKSVSKETKNEEEDDDDDEATDKPPHRCYTPGYLMEASVLVLVDNMQGFFKAVLGDEVQKSAARRQTILTLMESGDLIVEKHGITYKIHSPVMFVGCDNDNPFVKFSTYNTEEYDDDHAMERRFVVQDWGDLAHNTPQTRRGSIGVIMEGIKDFNAKNSSRVSFSPEVTDRLLVNYSSPDMIRLDYDYLRNHEVFALASFALTKGRDHKLTLDDLIALEREREPKTRFRHVNRRFEDRIEDLPERRVGEVFGIGLYSGGAGDLMPIRSGVLLELATAEKNFVHHDTATGFDAPRGMNSADTNKGYFEAVDYLKKLLGQPVRFVTKTTFHQEAGAEGPSASLPILLSLHSAFSGHDVYTNTAFTGTVSFSDGTIGPIGGVYDKALTVWKANERMQQFGRRQPMRFVFPAENYVELKHQLKVCPYPVESDIELIPARTFAEALYIARHSAQVDMKELLDKADEFAEKDLTQVRSNTTRWNKKVLSAYNGHLNKR